MINQEDLTKNIDRSRLLSQAKTMLDQNIPMETISQQLGLDRNTLNNLLLQNQLMPETVLQPEDYRSSYGPTGIMSNQIQDADTNMVIDDIVKGGEKSEDIIKFLGVDLGVDLGNLGGNPDDDTTQTLGQALNSGSVAGSIGSTDAMSSFLENASLLENLSDPEKLEVYKKAAADIIGEPDYDALLKEPDKIMPYLAAGLSLIQSGEKGDEWGAALGKAFISGYGTKIKEEKEFTKGKRALELDRQNKINSLVTTFAVQDFATRASLNKTLLNSSLKAPIEVDIVGPSGTFADKSSLYLDEAVFSEYARNNPGKIREAKNFNKQPYTLIDKNGIGVNVWMDNDMINELSNNPLLAGRIKQGHEDRTNGKLYRYTQNGETVEKFLTQEAFNALPKEVRENAIPMPTTGGTPQWVRDNVSGEELWIAPTELLRNSNKYTKIMNGWSMIVNDDGSTEMAYGSNTSIREANKKYEIVNNKLLGVDRGFENYFIAADQLDKAITDFTSQYPEQADLLFDNLAGNFAGFADNVAISLGAFNSMFTAPENEGGYRFKIQKDANDEGTYVDYEVMRQSVVGSTDFEEFKKSPFARMLEASGITGARLEAALFDLAMLGAASMNIDKGLDLRAISDFETKQFMQLQGGNTASLKQYQAVANDFRLKLVRKNIAEIDRNLYDSNLLLITDRFGQPDLDKQEALKKTGLKIRKKLEDRLATLEEMDTSEKLNSKVETFVTDPAVGGGDENVKVFPTIQISPNSQFGQSIGITEPVNTETKLELVDGTFSYRDLMNNYARYANEPQLQQSYYLSLQKQLTPAQFQILNIHLIQAGLIQAQ